MTDSNLTTVRCLLFFSVHEPDGPMDGDAAYSAARRKTLRVSWALATSSFAIVVLLCALCLFFFFHPRACWDPERAGGPFGSTETILDEIRSVNYERLESSTGSADVRLPANVVPDSYAVRIVPFLWAGNSTFDGQVDIVVNATAAMDNVTLHAVDLNVTECMVSRYVRSSYSDNL